MKVLEGCIIKKKSPTDLSAGISRSVSFFPIFYGSGSGSGSGGGSGGGGPSVFKILTSLKFESFGPRAVSVEQLANERQNKQSMITERLFFMDFHLLSIYFPDFCRTTQFAHFDYREKFSPVFTELKNPPFNCK